MGFLNILNAVRANNITRFVYASSAAAYGTPASLPLDENVALNPDSPYGLEKQINEQYADLYKRLYRISACGMRYFNVYGPRQDPRSPYAGVIALFADAILSKQALQIYEPCPNSRLQSILCDRSRSAQYEPPRLRHCRRWRC